jgi:hypothetical protein
LLQDLEFESGTAKFDLILEIIEAEGLHCSFEYNTDVFDRARPRQYRTLFRFPRNSPPRPLDIESGHRAHKLPAFHKRLGRQCYATSSRLRDGAYLSTRVNACTYTARLTYSKICVSARLTNLHGSAEAPLTSGKWSWNRRAHITASCYKTSDTAH